MAVWNSGSRLALAVYRRLVTLYPRSLRRELGGEMEGLFLDLHSEARRRGRVRAMWFAVRACAEVAPRALQAHGDPNFPTGACLVRNFFSDLRFAWLAAIRQRRHTAVVVATIAIGIGATTAVFSITDAAILRPLPFPEGHRLVSVAQQHPSGWKIYGQNAATFQAWHEQAELFDRLGGYSTTTVVSEIAGKPQEIDAVRLSPGLLPALGAQPLVGRLLLEEDAAEGAAPVVLISDRVWQREFARATDAVGRWISLGGIENEVVGVLPNDFAFPQGRTDVWLPVDPTRSDGYTRALGRLAPGLELPAAQEMADLLAVGMAEEFPREEGWNLALIPLTDQRTTKDTRTALVAGLAAAGLLLLVAVVNVAQVALARSSVRESEFAVRSALGAGRARIMRQVLFESLLLSVAGGLLGVVLANGLVMMISAAAPDNMVRIDSIQLGIEWRAFAVALLFSVSAGVAAGVLPAWVSSRRTAATALQSRQRGLSVSRGRRRAQGSLIAAEAALCMVLLAGAGLLLNSFERLTNVDPGFDADSLVSLVLSLDEDRYPTPDARLGMLDDLAARVARLPGVDSVTLGGDSVPTPGGTMVVDGLEADDGDRVDGSTILPFGRVGSGFFATAGIEMLAGRPLGVQDYDTENVVIAEPLARRIFGEERAVGRRFRLEDGDWQSVVGVVAPTASFDLRTSDDDFQIYLPLKSTATPWAYAAVIVRATGDPAALVPLLQRALWDLDPQQPVRRFELGSDKVAGWLVETRFSALVFGTFAGVALVLVLIGIAGVVSHAAVSRTREIGIRVALGAEARSILALATFGGIRPVLVGLALGGIGVWQTTHFLRSLLYGIEPSDPATLAAVVLVFLAASLVAAYIPARRVLRVDPVRALRTE